MVGDAPIFVIGTGRSGTTLLRLMLCAHPRIHLTHEGSFWLWEKVAGSRRSGDEVLRFYLRTLHFRWMGLDPREVMRELPHPLPRGELRRAYARVMRLQAARHGKPRWGDKTPSHSGHLERIFQDFPNAKVVRIVRDPRAVVRSLVRMPWAGPSLAAAAALVGWECRQVRRFRNRIFEVRFETLLQRPRETLSEVLDFVGEPWDDAVLAHHEHLPNPDDTPPFPWFDGATKARTPWQPTDWTRWDPVRVRLLECLTRGAMRTDGYRVAPLPARVSGLRVLRRWLADLPLFFHSVRIAVRLARRARDPLWDLDADAMSTLRSLNPESWKRYPGFEWPSAPTLPKEWEETP